VNGVLERLRSTDLAVGAGVGASALGGGQFEGVRMVATGGPLEDVFHRAVRELVEHCIRSLDGSPPVLLEGGVYVGTWIESTASINAEVLSRFLPTVARDTFLLLAERVRADGLLPYKVTDAGPSYRQIQIVTPLARCVWNHYALHGGDDRFLRTMYDAMARNDAWLAAHRDTRGTGCVEAFCAFDTGHDLSPRFWHVPDTTYGEDPARYEPDSPILPFVAPDLTANVACQRQYLAQIAGELGEDPAPWRARAARSTEALFAHCYDESDGMFYDVDVNGAWVRVQSDVLLRVLACEIGDDEFFASCLRRYLLNTRKFFAQFPFTSIALDDPRFSQDFSRNSWAGPSNFLSLIRAPHAFEHHGRHVELSWALMPVLAAVCQMTRFPQTLNPWTGEQGFTEQYSPSILWTIDAVERLAGILPRPDGELWCTALLPYGVHHEPVADAVGYARLIDSSTYEFVHDRAQAALYRDGEEHARFPHGWRLVLDRAGQIRAVVGMSARTVAGSLVTAGYTVGLAVAGNERVEIDGRVQVVGRTPVPLVHPST
jgi:hypothetical protein